MNEIYLEEDEPGPCHCSEPYVEEIESERDGVDPVDVAPFTSGDDPVITAPGDEEDLQQVLQEAVRSLSRLNDGLMSVFALSRELRDEVPDVDVYAGQPGVGLAQAPA